MRVARALTLCGAPQALRRHAQLRQELQHTVLEERESSCVERAELRVTQRRLTDSTEARAKSASRSVRRALLTP